MASFKDKIGAVSRVNLKKFLDFDGDWEAYKLYLFQNNALSPELQDQFRRPQIESARYLPGGDE